MTAYTSSLDATFGILSHYRCDDNNTRTITDRLGVQPATFYPGNSLTTAGLVDAGSALTFNGGSQYFDFVRDPSIHADFSLECWFKTTHGIGSNATQWYEGAGIFGADVSGVHDDFGVSIDKNGYIVAGIGNPNTSARSLTGGFNDNGWHHLVFTRLQEIGLFVVWVDGKLQAQGNGSTNDLTSPSHIAVGAIRSSFDGSTTNFFNGSIDEVAVYNQVVDHSHVLAHYNAGVGVSGFTQPTSTGTLGDPGYWNMVATDYSGNSIGELRNVYDRQFTFTHNNMNSGQFRIVEDHPLFTPIVKANCRIKLYDPTGTLRMHGPIVAVQLTGDAVRHTATIMFADPLWILQRRLLGKSDTGYSDGTVDVPLDRGTMSADIINAVNADHDTGVRVGAINPSATGQIGPLFYTPAAQTIMSLSAPLNGFDFQIVATEPTVDSLGTQIGVFTCGSMIGQARPELAFEYAVGAKNVTTWSDQVTLDGLANSWYILPPNFPTNAVQAPINKTDATSMAKWGLLEGTLSSDIISDTLRDQLASEYLRIRKVPRQVITFAPGMNAPEAFVDYGLGDTVRFRAASQTESNLIVDAIVRVFAVQISIDDNGKQVAQPALIDDSTAGTTLNA